jgi:hypothetical protein
VFGNGTTPAIAASVQHAGSGSVIIVGDKVSSTFAGGNAAVYAAGEAPTNGLAAVACVNGPVPHVYQPGTVAPLVFGTDTVIGLHVTFPAGPSQPQIVSANLGYKRFEMAVAPLFSSGDGCKKQQLADLAQQAADQADAVVAADEAADKTATKTPPDKEAQDKVAKNLADQQPRREQRT